MLFRSLLYHTARDCKGLYAFYVNFFLNLEKNAVTLTVLRFCSLLHAEVVLRDIHSIEYYAQITQTILYSINIPRVCTVM